MALVLVYNGRDDVGAAQHQDIAVQVVDEPQREHDLVDGDLGGDARDEGGEHKQVVDQPAARETEAVEDIGQHRADEDGEQQDKDQGDAGVQKAPQHVRPLKGGDKVVEVEPVFGRGEDVGGVVLVRRLEGGEDADRHRDQGDGRKEDEQEVFQEGEDLVADAQIVLCLDGLGCDCHYRAASFAALRAARAAFLRSFSC